MLGLQQLLQLPEITTANYNLAYVLCSSTSKLVLRWVWLKYPNFVPFLLLVHDKLSRSTLSQPHAFPCAWLRDKLVQG